MRQARVQPWVQAWVFAALAVLGGTLAVPAPAAAQGGPGWLPPFEVVTILRSTGLRPTGEPVRRGPSYAVTAIDPAGEEVRVVVDARSGEIIAVRPLGGYAGRPYRPDIVYIDPPPLPGRGAPVVIYDDRPLYYHYPPEAPPRRHAPSYADPRVIPAPGVTGALPRQEAQRPPVPQSRTASARVAGPPPMPRPRPEETSAAPVKSWPGIEKETDAAPLPPPVPDAEPGAAPLPE